MAGVNKVILIGNLGRDPEMRYTQGGTAVCRLNIATTRRYQNRQTNEMVEETEWHRVTVWGKSAEHCNNYLSRGRQVYVEGRLRTSSYEDKDGVKKYSTEVVADTVQFLGSKGGGQDGGGGGGGAGPSFDGGGGESTGSGASGSGDSPGGGDSSGGGGGFSGPEDDDIPF